MALPLPVALGDSSWLSSPSKRAAAEAGWLDADWDILLTLPLPEELDAKILSSEAAAAAALAATASSPSKGKPSSPTKRKPPSPPPSKQTNENSDVRLRKGLQLAPNDDSTSDGSNYSNAWVINELRQRVLKAGLRVKVIKLLPCPDDNYELPGEHEVESGHQIAIVCIGAAKEMVEVDGDEEDEDKEPEEPAILLRGADRRVGITTTTTSSVPISSTAAPPPWVLMPSSPTIVASAPSSPPIIQQQVARQATSLPKPTALPPPRAPPRAPLASPPPTPPPTPPPVPKSPSPNKKKPPPPSPLSRESASTRRLRAERFPRLEQVAEKDEIMLRTVGSGPRARFRVSNVHLFPPFRSKLRQQLLERILQAPRSEGGAGLNLDELGASGRVREVIYVHDDDECADVHQRLVYGVAGLCPMREATIETLFSYAGGVLSFYFTWIAAYTRSLQLPALVGLILHLLDAWHFEAAMGAERNATREAIALVRSEAAEAASGVMELYGGMDTPLCLNANTSLEAAIYEAEAAAAASHGDVGLIRAWLMVLFMCFIILWSASFDEYWKRRQALLAHKWGAAGSKEPPPPPINPKFNGQPSTGFYTREGLWVPLGDKAALGMSHERLKRSKSEVQEEESGVFSRSLELLQTQMDLYFPKRTQLLRQAASALVLVLMAAACILSIFSLQLFAAYMETVTVLIGTTDYSSIVVSVSQATVIGLFNFTWRKIALLLAEWENYRVQPVHVGALTYKLFIFQCINCYFSLFYIAFLKPSGISLFGIQMERCEVVPSVEGGRSCADEVRALLMSILLMNIVVGQAVEVGVLVGKGLKVKLLGELKECVGKIKSKRKARKGVAKDDDATAAAAAMEAAEESAAAAAAAAAAASAKVFPPVREAEEKKILDVVAEFERPPLKSIEQGLGSTFYEYNEMALQYGFLICFSAAVPLAPLLAYANNLIEVRSDALKMLYAARRVRADDSAVDIGPWAHALRTVSFAGILINVCYLGLTTDFFNQVGHYAPAFRQTSPRIAACVVAEHLLLLLKVLVDKAIPDVPDRIHIDRTRDEFLVDHFHKKKASAKGGAGAGTGTGGGGGASAAAAAAAGAAKPLAGAVVVAAVPAAVSTTAAAVSAVVRPTETPKRLTPVPAGSEALAALERAQNAHKQLQARKQASIGAGGVALREPQEQVPDVLQYL